ncbi:phage baseplate assembly protein V [Streptomyces vinaceus]|uniref:phage baseplate assembly protein V n=1 Tax=Streptomyces vinaceus TaxID=1960 RepID=UPI0037FEB014
MTVPVASPPAVRATVKAGPVAPVALRPEVERKILRVVVDTNLHLPGMFEITLLDPEGTAVSEAGLHIGARVEVYGGEASSATAARLVSGEVTSIEAICERMSIRTVVRGYDRAHRLQRTRRTRTFINMKDTDVARQIALEARLEIGQLDESRTTHAHLSQMAQSDWDFLQSRARDIGFEAGVSEGRFYFRKASSAGSGSGLLGGLPRNTGRTAELRFGANLLSFNPRITSANLAPAVEVRSWNPESGSVTVGHAAARSGTARLDEDPASVTAPYFPGGALASEALARVPVGGRAPEPDRRAHVVVNRPAGSGAGATAAADEMADGLAENISSAFAEAIGIVQGDPAVRAGQGVEVDGVPPMFAGTWLVTSARHVFCEDEGGYLTHFCVSGRQDRSLLGLATGGDRRGHRGLRGPVCAIVTNISDPSSHGRVKVSLPWLSPDYESDWARVMQFGAGKHSGAMFLPEVGDEVLVVFEQDDPDRPLVLGGLLNPQTAYTLGGPAVKANGAAGSVVRRGFVSSTGNKLLFEDEGPAGGRNPIRSTITLGDAAEDLRLCIDERAGQIHLTCRPTGRQDGGKGTITIATAAGGTVNVDSGSTGSVNVTGGSINLKAAKSLDLSSDGPLNISGRRVKITGTPIELN